MKYIITALCLITLALSCKKDEPVVTTDFVIEATSSDNQVWINTANVYNGSCCKALVWKRRYTIEKGNHLKITVGSLKWDVPKLIIYAEDTVYYTETKVGPINYTLTF